jgi:hypothetical protein
VKKAALVTLAIVALFVAGCSDPVTAKRVVEDAGYKNVQITGHRWFGCGEHDTYSTGWTGTGATGGEVSGVVCSHSTIFGKANTIRVD